LGNCCRGGLLCEALGWLLLLALAHYISS
jgi:hypothetical protein